MPGGATPGIQKATSHPSSSEPKVKGAGDNSKDARSKEYNRNALQEAAPGYASREATVNRRPSEMLAAMPSAIAARNAGRIDGTTKIERCRVQAIAAMPDRAAQRMEPNSAATTQTRDSGMATDAVSRTRNHGATASGAEFVWCARNSDSASG